MSIEENRSLERQPQGLGEKPALLVVDVIRGFTDPACPLGSDADSVVSANRALMRVFHDRGLRVFLTTVVYDNANQASVFRARVPALNLLTRGSHWCDIDPRLPLIDSDYIVEKTHASAFHGTDLASTLRASNIDSLVITGLTTSGCVRASAVDGLQHNFKVVIPEEATGDRDRDAHKSNLYDLNAKYVDVVSVEDTIRTLLSNSE
ncbi:isochorismatase family protein [Luminiphilus sp.]|nr:isochorismatase family protein [Luminiphilus sp.]